MAEKPKGCGRVTGSVMGEPKTEEAPVQPGPRQEESAMTVRVGQKAPDFQAPAYHKGSFSSIKLSDHFGKWILLCFYPGDFTFV